jgi:hypothetical protein
MSKPKSTTQPITLPDITIDWEDVMARRKKFDDEHRTPFGAIMWSAGDRDLLDISDLTDRFFAERIVHDPNMNTIHIRFSYDYEIELRRISSGLSLVGWADHLLGKTWMNGEFTREFMRRVCKIKGCDHHRAAK